MTSSKTLSAEQVQVEAWYKGHKIATNELLLMASLQERVGEICYQVLQQERQGGEEEMYCSIMTGTICSAVVPLLQLATHYQMDMDIRQQIMPSSDILCIWTALSDLSRYVGALFSCVVAGIDSKVAHLRIAVVWGILFDLCRVIGIDFTSAVQRTVKGI